MSKKCAATLLVSCCCGARWSGTFTEQRIRDYLVERFKADHAHCNAKIAEVVRKKLAETRDAAWKEVERQHRQDLKKVRDIVNSDK